MTTKEILNEYFRGLIKKSCWEYLIADDFRFLGARNMTEPPVLGKAGFIQVMTNFYNLFAAMRVKDQVVDGDRAYVLTNYDLSFPNGKKANLDTVERWTVRDGMALR